MFARLLYLEVYVWQQLEGLGVEPQVQKHLRMVHVVREVCRAGEVAE